MYQNCIKNYEFERLFMKFWTVSMWIDNIKLSNGLQVPKCRDYGIIGTFLVCALCSSQFIYNF